MTPEQWERIRNVVEEALEASPDQRNAILNKACSSDPSLRREVEALLDSNNDVLSSLLELPSELADELVASLDATASPFGVQAGEVFDERFLLIQKLGEGGMGQVWLAEQTAPVRRQVALKVIRAGMYDESVVQRFQAERQSLAMMDHPAIAKVFDAGTTPQGQPYFVMEYVPGLPLTEYCDREKLNLRDRLELFIEACEGVQHAHQKAIMHRDLKPANILVVEVDGRPVPRIIDFGLAKTVTRQNDGQSVFTQIGDFVGTPGYMSPEQADPDANDVDTRTDVYSLGVVLYVLLTGAKPFDAKAGEKVPLDELLRRLRQDEPPSPSNRVNADSKTSTSTAEARSTEPKQLVQLLRGDLDWITLRAIEKDRNRRYGSPAELAADICRYLNYEAIMARPASTGYRLRKYVRRNRIAVGVAAGLLLLLGTFSAIQATELRRITRERDRANRITNFMTEMFKVSDPTQGRADKVTAREILDNASNGVESGLKKDPEEQAQMMQVMAQTYLNLGIFSRAHELNERALHAELSLLGPNHRQTLESKTQMGSILGHEGHYDEAEKLEREALEGDRRNLDPEDPLALKTMGELAIILGYEGHFEDKERLEREVITIADRNPTLDNSLKLRSMENLAIALNNEARYSEAEQEYRQVLELEGVSLPPDDFRILRVKNNLAVAIQLQGRTAEAEQIDRKNLTDEERVLGPGHPLTLLCLENLATIADAEGHKSEAEKLYRQALSIRLQAEGPENPDTLSDQQNLASVLAGENRLEEAEKLQRETLAIETRILGLQNPDTLISQSNLAEILDERGKYTEAEVIARKTYESRVRILGSQHPDTITTLQHLGVILAHTNRYAEASRMFHEATEAQTGGKGNPFAIWYSFACVAAEGHRSEDALHYLREAISRGYKDADAMLADEDFRNLLGNPKFQQMAADLKRTNEVSGKSADH